LPATVAVAAEAMVSKKPPKRGEFGDGTGQLRPIRYSALQIVHKKHFYLSENSSTFDLELVIVPGAS
jgi:hypothetical protein